MRYWRQSHHQKLEHQIDEREQSQREIEQALHGGLRMRGRGSGVAAAKVARTALRPDPHRLDYRAMHIHRVFTRFVAY